MDKFDNMITNFKPLLVMAGFLCTDYCVFSVRFNYHDRPEELYAKWKASLPMLRNTMKNLRRQHDEGRLFFLHGKPAQLPALGSRAGEKSRVAAGGH